MNQKCVLFIKCKDSYLLSLWKKNRALFWGSAAHPFGDTVSTRQKGTYMAYNCCSQLIF